ncbi:MAG: amidotransferase [Bacteroidetes bacterium]|nr:amidotransferase [Bacteroidota bacterium]
MNVHYLQHVPFEGPGYIEPWLKKAGHSISATRLYEAGFKLPGVDTIDALIVMGGPMGVYDEHIYPWLLPEKAFIEDCIRSGRKVLGICLGAQLTAVCLGAKVHPAPNKEIGWFPVIPTPSSKTVPWLYELFRDKPVVFHWHGDQFGIPAGCVDLLSSAANINQAFYYNEKVIALQFHLEVTEKSMQLMLEHGAGELTVAPHVQTAGRISAETYYIEKCNRIMSAILDHWLG